MKKQKHGKTWKTNDRLINSIFFFVFPEIPFNQNDSGRFFL